MKNMNIIQFTPKEKEEFIKRLSTYTKRSAAIREMSKDHQSTTKKSWRSSMQHKQEMDNEKVRLAKSYPEPSKNWQKIILKTVETTAKPKTVVFVVNNTHNIGRSAKCRYGDDNPELQKKSK